MTKYTKVTLFVSILMIIPLLAGCDLGLVGEIVIPGGNSTDALQGTIVDAAEFTWNGQEVLTLPELYAGEKLIIAISPFDTASVSAYQYRVRITTGINPMSAQAVRLATGTHRLMGLRKDVIPFPETEERIGNVGTEEVMGDYFSYHGGETVKSEMMTAPAQRAWGVEAESGTPLRTANHVELLSTRNFYVRTDANVNRFKSVTATLAKSSSTLEIYVSTDAISSVPGTILDKIANEFARKVYPTVTGFMGVPYDKDYNGKTTLLITPLLYNGSATKMIGYFDEVNLFDKTENNYSNETDMIYMNSNVVAKGDMTQIYGNLTHEFAHLIFGGKKYKADPNGIRFNSLVYSDRWFNEGCAMLATHVAGYTSLSNDWRIYDRNYGYFGYPNKDGLLTWEGSREESNYGSSALFAYYLYDQYRSVFEAILKTPTKVEVAMQNYTQREFSQLLRDWMLTNFGDRLSGYSEYHYPYLALKSSPVYKTLTGTTDFTINGMGVQYFAIEGPVSNLEIGLSFPSGKQTVLNAGYLIIQTR